LLTDYVKFPPAKSGPTFLPLLFSLRSPAHSVLQQLRRNYSAQQARLDHLGQEEIVEIIVEIRLTPSYGAFISSPLRSRSSSLPDFTPRSSLFWKDFHVQIYDGGQSLSPPTLTAMQTTVAGVAALAS